MKNKGKSKVIVAPEKDLDMFAKYGVKTIIAGSKTIKIKKNPKMINAKTGKPFEGGLY